MDPLLSSIFIIDDEGQNVFLFFSNSDEEQNILVDNFLRESFEKKKVR